MDCGRDDIINIEVNDNVTINAGIYGSAIKVNGSLNLYGTGTLTLVPSEFGSKYSIPTMQASKNLIFSGATLNVSAQEELNRAITAEYGDVILKENAKAVCKASGKKGYAVYASENVTLSGNAQLKAEGEGPNSAGIIVKSGDITVDDNASLEARGLGEGYALDIRQGSLIVNNDNVTLHADDPDHISTRPNIGTGQVETQTPQETPETPETGKSSGGGGGCNAGFIGLALMALATATLRRKK